ncbi:MAG: 5-methyltetrahydropteroyltriglutamate--homocysteine methyltransferase, partial [Cytophaga sp.]|nr:5-methyltetrahydropteroyltriglutamate--homocysteine methyltransferase [Cytophaga sp.]
KEKKSTLQAIREFSKNDQRIFLGVTNVLDPHVETPEEVCALIMEAAKVIPVERLGTTDDCGFSPFADDVSTARETAFAKIKARVQGTLLAETKL